MYKKVENVLEKLSKPKFVVRFLLFFFVIYFALLCINVTLGDRWKNITAYPEEDYQLLESEAWKIVKSGNFEETNCPYEITYYNSTTHKIYFDLSYNTATVTVGVEDFRVSDSVSVKRSCSNKTVFVFGQVLSLVIFPALFAGVTLTALYLVLLILHIFFTIVDLINFWKKCKKEEKK